MPLSKLVPAHLRPQVRAPAAWYSTQQDSSNSHWEQQQQQQQQQAAAERGGVPSSKLKPLPLQHQVLHQQQQQQLQQQQPHSPSGSLERGRSPAVVHATASGAVYGTVARGSPAGTLGQSCHEPPPIPHKSPPRLEGSPSIQLPTEPVSSKPGAAEGSSSSQHGTSVFQSPSPALEFAKGLPTLQVADGTDPVTLASGQVLEGEWVSVLGLFVLEYKPPPFGVQVLTAGLFVLRGAVSVGGCRPGC
eukprot:1161620-Pelagomonas_calceolata.AAC.2